MSPWDTVYAKYSSTLYLLLTSLFLAWEKTLTTCKELKKISRVVVESFRHVYMDAHIASPPRLLKTSEERAPQSLEEMFMNNKGNY